MICHWDEVETGRGEAGHIAGEWTDLGVGAGTKTVGLNRIRIDPGKWSTPFHRQTAEEEIFFVLAGSGVCLLDGSAFEVRPGDCIVHRVREAHTLRAGDDGLDALAFGTRGRIEVGHLPRAGVGWVGGTWAEVGMGDHPWEREAAVGEPELAEVGARPARVVNVDESSPGWHRRGSRTASAQARQASRISRTGRETQRRLLLPALQQDLLPRPRPDRPPRVSRRRRAAVGAG